MHILKTLKTHKILLKNGTLFMNMNQGKLHVFSISGSGLSNVKVVVAYCTTQRALNDLQRTRLSCCRKIRLLAHPLPLPLSGQQVFLGLPLRRRWSLLKREGDREGARSQIM